MEKQNVCCVCYTTLSTGGKVWDEMSERTYYKEASFHFACWKQWRADGFPELKDYTIESVLERRKNGRKQE